MVPLRYTTDCGILEYGYHILFGGKRMCIRKEYLQDLLMGLTIMEGELCELLSEVCRHRERFRMLIDEWNDEQDGQRDAWVGKV